MAASGIHVLTPDEVEQLRLRFAISNSLNDNATLESIAIDLVAAREQPVPAYSLEPTAHDLLRHDIDANSAEVWDNLFRAIEAGQIDALDHFVALGVDLNTPNPKRLQYPIHHAVRHSQTNMMRHLINLNCDVNVWSVPGGLRAVRPDYERTRTPLMAAAENGNLNICKILCESAFADPMLVAPDGQTAQRLAARNGHKEIVEYLPANRAGAYLRLSYDFNHRWSILRTAGHGIYVFCRITFLEIPRFLLVTLPWSALKGCTRGLRRLYLGIPPISEWGRIIARAAESMVMGLKDFIVGLGKVIAKPPKAVYRAGKHVFKEVWKGIKTIPAIVKLGAQKTWQGLKAFGRWSQNFLLSIVSFIHTLISAIMDFFRSITIADIIAGLQTIFRVISIDLPRMLWQGLVAVGKGIHITLASLFGGLYWCVYWIAFGIQWVCLYVPKKIGTIILQIVGGIQKAFTELFLWFYPKAMA